MHRAKMLTLNLGFDIVDGVRRLHLKGDSLAREGLYEDLHTEDLLGVNGYLLYEWNELTSTKLSSSTLWMQVNLRRK